MPRPLVHQDVVGHLARRILSGELPPGTTLPNTDLLSRQLGVSRSALREAARVLGAKGLIETRPKVGTRVRDRAGWNLFDPDLLDWCGATIDAALLADLLEYRRLVEPGAAALSAARASAAQVAVIERAFHGMQLADLETARVKADLDFHVAVLDASGNAFLTHWATSLASLLLAEFRASSRRAPSPDAGFPAHLLVLEAIRLRRPDQARAAYETLLDLAALHLSRPSPHVSPSKVGPSAP